MRFSRTLASLAAMLVAAVTFAAQPALADENTDSDFAKRVFAGAVSKPKVYACFVRHYDAQHLAQHPLQKVSVMKLLITAEQVPESKTLSYSFRLGVNFRNRPGSFDSSGDCDHLQAEDAKAQGIDLGCGVDCDGGGISTTLAKDNASVIVKLDRIRIWKDNAPDDEAIHELQGGADDKVFRLDRADVNECASLVSDRKELAAMRHK
jgi:hypothetical protein